ncbi:MAG: AF1514 family protein [Pseudomonadota bacterium]|nr:AF1514 family protein [Pseudomonadota bacterium]
MVKESRLGADSGVSCPLPQAPDFSGITLVKLHPRPVLADYLAAMQLANAEAAERLGDYMLLSWYDRDRDFESPQHSSECHQASAVPGYVDYGIHHGATLMVDIEDGRFVFFYLPVSI